MRLLRTTGRGAIETRRVLSALENRRESSAESVAPAVRYIVSAVRKGGDKALRRYAARFDGLSPQTPLQISHEEMEQAWQQTSRSIKNALKVAASNIRAFAKRQLPTSWSFSPTSGLSTGQMVRPICAVGCYVPSGRHPLPSSLLMTAIPAQVAGVPRIVVASPNPGVGTLAAAHLLGINEFYSGGGAQAIAALAYGTETIARVDKIVGPGNLYVTAAKKMVAFDCAIDMLAGPTEIVVTSDKCDPAYIAAELVAQAEHDPEALAILVTTRPELASQVIAEVKLQSKANAIARQSLAANGYVFLASSLQEAQEITNRLAPEHLTVDDPSDTQWVQNAGSIFIGSLSPQAMGDYVSGPNHTLPTGGFARVRGGLGALDFVKLITVQQYDEPSLQKLGPSAIALAEAEGLLGHAAAIRARGIASGDTSAKTMRGKAYA
jgi:histidinol dehydrogenase